MLWLFLLKNFIAYNCLLLLYDFAEIFVYIVQPKFGLKQFTEFFPKS